VRAARALRPLRRPGALLLGAAALWACTEFATEPGVPVALSFTALPAPSVVLGDTLRDASGAPVQVEAMALDALGDPVDVSGIVFRSSDAQLFVVSPERYVVADTPYYIVTANPTNGALDSTRVDSAFVLASAGGVQSAIRLSVTRVPEELVRESGERDSVEFSPLTAIVDSAQPLRVTLESAGDSAVYRYLVSFSILHDGAEVPQDSTSPFTLRNGRGGPISTIDTTGADGIAERAVRIDRRRLPCPADHTPDSIVVVASVRPKLDVLLEQRSTIVIDTTGFETTGCGP
jgi:hypothetical protein